MAAMPKHAAAVAEFLHCFAQEILFLDLFHFPDCLGSQGAIQYSFGTFGCAPSEAPTYARSLYSVAEWVIANLSSFDTAMRGQEQNGFQKAHLLLAPVGQCKPCGGKFNSITAFIA